MARRMYNEIEFNTVEAKNVFGGENKVYQGTIVHNNVMNCAETRRRFAECTRLGLPMANMYLDSLTEFIADGIAHGYRMDFGPFSVALKMRGGFPASNSAFDENENSIAVEFTPCKQIKTAVKSLKPKNSRGGKSEIYSFVQSKPKLTGSNGRLLYSTISSDGERLIDISGSEIRQHAEVADERVEIVNEAGETVLRADEIIETAASYVRCIFRGHIEPGKYWLAVYSHRPGEAELLCARHRLKVK